MCVYMFDHMKEQNYTKCMSTCTNSESHQCWDGSLFFNIVCSSLICGWGMRHTRLLPTSYKKNWEGPRGSPMGSTEYLYKAVHHNMYMQMPC